MAEPGGGSPPEPTPAAYAPTNTVFDYVLDIRNLRVVPDVGLADVDQKPQGVGATARLFAHFLGIRFATRTFAAK